VRQGTIEVKVEVNFVMRGTVNPLRTASLTQSARDTLQADLEVPVVSLEDVYGGKLVAAMDRQHPRDLFDVMQLFAHEGNPRLFGRDAFNSERPVSFEMPEKFDNLCMIVPIARFESVLYNAETYEGLRLPADSNLATLLGSYL
jgi:Nucleotidyl transferase AbiEii toxin, Type IV TA system